MKVFFALAVALLLTPQAASAEQDSWTGAAALAVPATPGSGGALVSKFRSGDRVLLPETETAASFILSFLSPSPNFTTGEPCLACVVPKGATTVDPYSLGMNATYPFFGTKSPYVIGTIEGTSFGFTGKATVVDELIDAKGKVVARGSFAASIQNGYAYLWYFYFKRPALHGAAKLAAELVYGKTTSNVVESNILFQ